MDRKKKIIMLIIGIEAVIIAGVIVFLFCIHSDAVKINRQLELAQRYLLEEDYEQAIATFEIIIEIDPKNVDAYLGLAEAYVLADELGNAVKTLEKAAEWTDSKEILDMLEIHTAEIERKELAAQRAAEAAALAAASVTEHVTNGLQQDTQTSEMQMPEFETVLRGFIVQDGELYYFDETGNFVTGWFYKNNDRYCARTDGKLYKSGEFEIDNVRYLFDQSGVCLGEMEDEQLPFNTSLKLVFSSGVGGWGTVLELNPDGTFSGDYSDSNMGEIGEGYPGGTVYICTFQGKFDNIRQIDEHTYSMTLSEIMTYDMPGEEWIEDDVLYIASEPFGIEDGEEFLLYTPGTPVNVLSDAFLVWWREYWNMDGTTKKTLTCYGLYNKKMGNGFFDY